ncbi:Spermatogenesis-associated protein 6 [Fasciola hepatica]|uniref:Spermatogenesis-associated protein 6 n=1 Tax=Fasciola hepatica TaxID=6192 RepID=A0A4E0R5Z7_FASHE|nr:Spermatogenesis-associated protein 6 [Fasciola hepatica]
MPTFKFEGDITLHCVHSPGTWLPNRDNLYIIIEIFNTARRTRLTEAIFPLLLHERFNFEKVVCSPKSYAIRRFTVHYQLQMYRICWKVRLDHNLQPTEDERVRIELRQITDVYCGGTLLAYFETNAKELFCPCPHMCLRTLPKNEFTMLRTVDFPGVSPRLEFTASSAIRSQTTTHYHADHTNCCHDCTTLYRPLYTTPNYYRPTVNSALRCTYSDLAQPQSYICSDRANHNARVRINEDVTFTKRPKSQSLLTRPRSASAKFAPKYTNIRSQPVAPVTSYSSSMWDLRERNIRDAQERSDRYWCLYRFWQNEAERRRNRVL